MRLRAATSRQEHSQLCGYLVRNATKLSALLTADDPSLPVRAATGKQRQIGKGNVFAAAL